MLVMGSEPCSHVAGAAGMKIDDSDEISAEDEQREHARTDDARSAERLEALVLEAVAHVSCPDPGPTEPAMVVTGQPIDEYCDSRQMDIRSRLELVARVCETVHVAHQHAMIHGDMTPLNVLVTDRGVPQVIGFGQAKLGRTAELGDADQANASVVYTSPEQIMGEPITTSVDIYALGVLLYQAMCGRSPYQVSSQNKSEVLQAICEQVPEKPSVAVGRRSQLPTPAEIGAARGVPSKRLQRQLRGDLDAIALKAIRKEPGQRYCSAEHLREDIRHYIDGQAVRAQPDSWRYHVKKFSKRHPVPVVAGLLVLMALVAGALAVTSIAISARQDRDRAGQTFDHALVVINDVFTHATEDPRFDQPSMQSLRISVLNEIRSLDEEFLRRHGADRTFRIEAALAYSHVARIASLANPGTDALTLYRQAIARWEELIAEQPKKPSVQENLVRTLNEFTAFLLGFDKNLPEAASRNRRAREVIESVASGDSGSAEHRRALSMMLQNRAEIQKRNGNSDEAIKELERAQEIETQLAAENFQSYASVIALADVHSRLGKLLAANSANLIQALESYSQAIQIREPIVTDHPELIEQSSRFAADLRASSALELKLKQPDAAFEDLQRSLEISEKISLAYPHIRPFQEALATSCNMMSAFLSRRGERVDALDRARKAKRLFESLQAADRENTKYSLGLAQSHTQIGRLHNAEGQPVLALQAFRRAIDLYESLPVIDPPTHYDLACSLALCIPLLGVSDPVPAAGSRAHELSNADRRRREIYGSRAVEELRRAAHDGFVQSETLESNSDLDSLRPLADFRSLMSDLDQKRANAVH